MEWREMRVTKCIEQIVVLRSERTRLHKNGEWKYSKIIKKTNKYKSSNCEIPFSGLHDDHFQKKNKKSNQMD